MSPERYRRAKALFLACGEKDPVERASFLAAECGDDVELRREVEGMLAIDEGHAAFLAEPPPVPPPSVRRVPAEIGRFRVLGVLGEGGMGTVYEAEQERPHRRVALKVMRPGFTNAHLARRFEVEVDVLGRLQHPGIAQIFEAGTYDDGYGPQPFFAMERIRGEHLLEHCRRLEFGTRARLELIVRVCDAVHHAHVHGVIHRDLKPANVLVDESGQPKVLDFGVARATDSDMQTMTSATDVGQLVGTLPYMSPEQVEADPARIDARSDVYALGVMIYELLTGQLPYEVRGKLIHEVARVIRDEDPTPLSIRDRVFRGDLDTIVAKALEKERERRYPSARALADDVGRYLREEPIVARPASRRYQLQKFAHRNKGFVGGVAAVFVALFLGLAGTAWQWARAEERRRDAEVEAGRVQSVLDFFLSGMMSSVNPWEQGRDVRMVTVIDRSAEQAEAAFGGDPDLEIEIRTSLGEIYRNLGYFQKAVPHVERSLELSRALRDEDGVEVLSLASLLGALFLDLALYARAREILEPTLAASRAALGPEHVMTLVCAHRTATLYQMTERYEEGLALHTENLAIRTRRFGPEHVDTLASKAGLAHSNLDLQQFGEAARLMAEVHAGRQRLLGDRHPSTVKALQFRARVLMELARFEESEELYRSVLATLREVLGDEHVDTLDAINEFGGAVHEARGAAAAEPLYREAVERGREILGDRHAGLAIYLNNLGSALEELGRWEEAKGLYFESLAIREDVNGPESLSVANALNNLATFHHRSGRMDDAEAYYLRAIDIYVAAFGEDHIDLARARSSLGTLLYQTGRIDEAERSYRAAAGTARAVLGPDDPQIPMFDSSLGFCLARLGRFDEAEPLFLASLAGYRRHSGEDQSDVQLSLERLVALYRRWKRPDDQSRFQAELDALLERVRSARDGEPAAAERAD